MEIKLFLVGGLLLVILNIWMFSMARSFTKKWIVLGASLIIMAAAFKWLFLPAWIRGI